MRKVEEVLRLKWGAGRSVREIARVLGIGRTTVSAYLDRAEAAGLSWPLPEDLSAGELERRLFKPGGRPAERGLVESDLEQGALAGAVAADDAEDFALLDLEVDVAQGPELAILAVAVVALTDPPQGIGLAAELGPPAVDVLAQGAAADEAEAVVFAEVFDLDDDGHGA